MAQGYQVNVPQRLTKVTADGLVPAVGWKITTYEAGTTTPLVTYSNPTLTSANLATIITNSAGFFNCFVAAGVDVKFVVTDENDNVQTDYEFDNEVPMIDPGSSSPSVTAVPTGGILAYGAASAPTGFLLCDGSIVSRATYATLFGVVGTTYGAGNGSTTFGLPNLSGRFPLGVATSGTGSTLGGTGGAIDHTHTGPSHTHGVTVPKTWTTTGSPVSPPTNAVLSVGNVGGAGQFSSQYQPTADLAITSDAGGTGNTGTANSPFQTVVYLIKT